MHTVSLEEAKEHLHVLVDQVAKGEDVIITRGDGATFKIVPTALNKNRPVFGSGRGLFKMADDFDDPLDDFKPYMQ